MSEARHSSVVVAGGRCRVSEKGEGETLAVLGGLGGIPRWTPFLDRLAAERRVVVLSPPGFPGSDDHHKAFNHYLDWIVATLDLVEAAGVVGADLLGASVGGRLAAEVAAFAPGYVKQLVLAAPFGLYDVDDPGEDPFAQTQQGAVAVQSANPEAWVAAFGPDPADPASLLDWTVMLYRAADATARILWPLGDRQLDRRLHRLRQPTLVLWGQNDRILPPSYAARFADRVTGPVEVRIVERAGHQLLVDQPDEAAAAVLKFLADGPA
jgi:pimeloyl-ACP methyl ester carboxylesterase